MGLHSAQPPTTDQREQPTAQYRVTHWLEYDHALVARALWRRGSMTIFRATTGIRRRPIGAVLLAAPPWSPSKPYWQFPA